MTAAMIRRLMARKVSPETISESERNEVESLRVLAFLVRQGLIRPVTA